MVSKASEDFPEPERPVNTTSLSRGMVRSTFLRLCSRAPRTTMLRPPNKASTGSAVLDARTGRAADLGPTMGVPGGGLFLNGNARSRANHACAGLALMLEQKKNKSKSACSSDARGGAEVSKGNRGVHGIPLMPVRRGAPAETAKRACSRLGEQFGARHKHDVSVEDRLGDAEKAGHDRRIVVKIHRRLAGEALVGREDTRIGDILRDEKSDGVRLIRANFLRDFEQGLAQSAFMTVLGADDRSNGQHGVLFLSQPGALESSGLSSKRASGGRGFAKTRDFRLM